MHGRIPHRGIEKRNVVISAFSACLGLDQPGHYRAEQGGARCAVAAAEDHLVRDAALFRQVQQISAPGQIGLRIKARLRCLRSLLAVAVYMTVDQFFIPLMDAFVIDAELFQRSRPHICDQDIALFGKAAENLNAIPAAKIHDDHPLPRIGI